MGRKGFISDWEIRSFTLYFPLSIAIGGVKLRRAGELGYSLPVPSLPALSSAHSLHLISHSSFPPFLSSPLNLQTFLSSPYRSCLLLLKCGSGLMVLIPRKIFEITDVRSWVLTHFEANFNTFDLQVSLK
jgi:hypothetical protein